MAYKMLVASLVLLCTATVYAQAPSPGTEINDSCGSCTVLLNNGLTNFTTGCDSSCGYCSLQSFDTCDGLTADGSGSCQGICSEFLEGISQGTVNGVLLPSTESEDAAVDPDAPAPVSDSTVPIADTSSDSSDGTSYVIIGAIPASLYNVDSTATVTEAVSSLMDSEDTTVLAVVADDAATTSPDTSNNLQLTLSPMTTPALPTLSSPSTSDQSAPVSAPSTDSPDSFQCLVSYQVSDTFGADKTEQAVNFYILNTGSSNVMVPYSVSVDIPGLVGYISNWNWGSIMVDDITMSGQLTLGWESLLAGTGETINFGAIVELDSAEASSVVPSSISVNGQECVLD